MTKRRRSTVERKAEWVEREGIEQAMMWLREGSEYDADGRPMDRRVSEEWSVTMATVALSSAVVRIEHLLAKPDPPVMERTPEEEVATWYEDVNFDHPPPPLMAGPWSRLDLVAAEDES